MPHRPPGVCMFCDATGVTKAHVFAESWTSLFDEPNDTREHEVVHRYTDPITGERRVLKRAKTFALFSRKVCGRCNSGWLNELEARVRPLMAHFAANTSITLNVEEQADLRALVGGRGSHRDEQRPRRGGVRRSRDRP